MKFNQQNRVRFALAAVLVATGMVVPMQADVVYDLSLKGVDRACVRLGLYPVRYTTYSGPRMNFDFGNPTIRIIDFDRAKRTIKLKVDPPDGSHVAAMPMFDYFHLVGICDFGTQEQHEIDIPLENIRTGFSEYMSGNGLFTLTYPETDARFFYLRVGDK